MQDYKYVFDTISEPWQAYFLGFLYADGSIGKREVLLILNEKDKDVIIKFAEKIYSNKYKLCYKKGQIVEFKNGTYQCGNSCGLRIYSNKIINNLKKFGMFGFKKNREKLPDIPFINSFILGYFDGDGCVTHSHKGRYLKIKIAGNRKLLEDIGRVMNIPFSLENYKTYSCLKIHRQNDIRLFYDFIYKDMEFCLNRKLDRFNAFYKSH